MIMADTNAFTAFFAELRPRLVADVAALRADLTTRFKFDDAADADAIEDEFVRRRLPCSFKTAAALHHGDAAAAMAAAMPAVITCVAFYQDESGLLEVGPFLDAVADIGQLEYDALLRECSDENFDDFGMLFVSYMHARRKPMVIRVACGLAVLAYASHCKPSR